MSLWHSTASATSRSSRTSTTASRRWPIASSRSPTRCPRARCARSCSTRWISSASAASRSRPRPCASSGSTRASTYTLNLIDTPGHVDFTYEVSRSLAACEGALLVVDAAQGLEAQTLANAHLAIENDLEIVPVLNKIDLPAAEPDRRAAEVADFLGGIARRRPAHLGQDRRRRRRRCSTRSSSASRRPRATVDAPARALVFDSTYDQYRGVVAFVRVVDGTLPHGPVGPLDGHRARACTSRRSAS